METKEKMTQCDMVLRHLKDFGTITSIEAITDYGILRFASRVSDLKRRGFRIKSERGAGVNRYGETTHYSIYSLEG